jgi:hypothetical protein
MRFTFLFIVLCTFQTLKGQSFILNQFFQPSLTTNAEYSFDFNKNNDRCSIGRINSNLIIPVKSKLGVEMDLSKIFSIRSFKDVKNMAEIKAYQIFWTFRPQITMVQYSPLTPKQSPFSDSTSLSYGVQTGITGLHLMKKLQILFYSVNLGVQEDFKTLKGIKPYGNAIVGVVNFNRLTYFWYYGVAISASEGQRLPIMGIPFIGVDLKLAKKFWWNITLPVQTRFEFKPSRYLKFDAVAGFASYNFGFGNRNNLGGFDRHYFSGWQFRTGLAINIKNKRGTKFYLEGGYMPFRSFHFDSRSKNSPFENPENLRPTPYIAVSLYYGFRKSLLGSTVENFLNF